MSTPLITPNGPFITQGGFMSGVAPALGDLPSSVPHISRFQGLSDNSELVQQINAIARGEFDGSQVSDVMTQFASAMQNLSRGITSATSNLPIRENLEAEVQILLPDDTPVRNRIRRSTGAGTAVKWRTITSYGGGWGSSVDQIGGGSSTQMFFLESGAPVTLASTYGARTASYKLMGAMGSVTGFAMASGANFMDQYQRERTSSILNLMLNEEFALISGDSTSTAAPWGDGTNALAFDGLINLITTANGVPSAQVQTSVGALTTAHLDAQLNRLWIKGGRNMWMLMNQQEATSLVHLMEASGSLLRIMAQGDSNKVNVGVYVGGYVHPLSGELVDIVVSRFVPAGTIMFLSDQGPMNQPTLEMEILPQVQLPKLAPGKDVQGYVLQELAPSQTAPQVYPWLLSFFGVLKLKNTNVVGKSTGVTAV